MVAKHGIYSIVTKLKLIIWKGDSNSTKGTPIELAKTANSTKVNSFRKIPYIRNTPVIGGRPSQNTVIGDKMKFIGLKASKINKISKRIPRTIIIGKALYTNSFVLIHVCLRITLEFGILYSCISIMSSVH